jgi:hypothetical protein
MYSYKKLRIYISLILNACYVHFCLKSKAVSFNWYMFSCCLISSFVSLPGNLYLKTDLKISSLPSLFFYHVCLVRSSSHTHVKVLVLPLCRIIQNYFLIVCFKFAPNLLQHIIRNFVAYCVYSSPLSVICRQSVLCFLLIGWSFCWTILCFGWGSCSLNDPTACGRSKKAAVTFP